MGDMVIGGNPCEECKFSKESCRKHKPQCLFRDDKKQQIVMKQERDIEIPFGAFDSELGGWEYTIPEGFEAEIKDGKVIVRKSESEDEKMRKVAIRACKYMVDNFENSTKDYEDAIDWLEKQGEQKSYKEHDICNTCNEQASCVDPCCAKLIEQKPIEMKSAEESLGISSEEYNKIVDDCIYGEQKPIDLVAIMKDYFANTPKEQQEKDWAELKHLNDVGFGIEIPFGAKDSELQETSYYIPEGFHAEIESNRVVIKKGEQKPAFEMKSPEESLGIDSDTYNKIVDECIYGEQKTKKCIYSKGN